MAIYALLVYRGWARNKPRYVARLQKFASMRRWGMTRTVQMSVELLTVSAFKFVGRLQGRILAYSQKHDTPESCTFS